MEEESQEHIVACTELDKNKNKWGSEIWKSIPWNSLWKDKNCSYIKRKLRHTRKDEKMKELIDNPDFYGTK